MRVSFIVIYVLLMLLAFAVNWRKLQGRSERFLFLLLAVIGIGLLWMYRFRQRYSLAPADWAFRMFGG